MIEFSNHNGGHHGHQLSTLKDVKQEDGVNESKPNEDIETEDGSTHHAVVKSESDSFRAMVLHAFQSLV